MSDTNLKGEKIILLPPRYIVIAHQSLVINVLKKLETNNVLQHFATFFWSALCVSSFFSTFMTKLG